jgi:hypothetical protein
MPALDPVQAIRVAIVAQLEAAAGLMGLLGGDPTRIVWRPRRVPIVTPVVSYQDFGARIDPQTPLLERSFVFDAWTSGLESQRHSSDLADAVVRALDQHPMGVLPGGEANVVYLNLTAITDRPDFDTTVYRTTAQFRMLAYRL